MAFSTIDKSSSFMNPVLYTGNASTQSITGVGFQPDMIWTKCRGASENHTLVDSVRGDSGANTGYWYLQPDYDNADASGSGNTLIDAITSDGFNVGNNDQVNVAQPFASWNWKAGTTSGITTNGSTTITPTGYSFNATSGFSIVKFTGTATSAQKIPHGLGVAPKFMMLKRLGSTDDWYVYHYGISANPSSEFLILNTTASIGNSGGAWSDTEPDSVNFTVGSRTNVNATDGMIAYCFAPITGYSKFGSYTGNGQADGTFVYTGFKPSFIICKKTNGADDWRILTENVNTRNTATNEVNKNLYAQSNAAESGTSIDFVSNGMKIRSTSGGINGNGDTYIYMAFGQPIISNGGVCATAR